MKIREMQLMIGGLEQGLELIKAENDVLERENENLKQNLNAMTAELAWCQDCGRELQRELAHLRATCHKFGVVPARLPDECSRIE